MKRVSFDFDATLSRVDVQIFARSLVKQGYEVWIVTSRPDVYVGELQHTQPDNGDLYSVAADVGIKPEHIYFTCYGLKSNFLDGNEFLFHLDDDDIELRYIADNGDDCVPVSVMKYGWEAKCKNVLDENT